MDNRDLCPTRGCGNNLGKQAFREDKWAGSVVRCKGCRIRYRISEKSDGIEEWYEFECVEPDPLG